MAGNELAFIDRGVLANLLSSGVAHTIMRESGYVFAAAAGIEVEQFPLWSDGNEPHGQELKREIVTATDLVQDSVLQIYALDGYVEMFVTLAIHLSDRQAMVAALACAHNANLLTDDRRTRRVLQQLGIALPTWGTTSILQQWQRLGQITDEEVAAVSRTITQRAQFHPPEDDLHHSWWLSMQQS